MTQASSITVNNPKVDGRKNRPGRFEIVIRHEEEVDFAAPTPVFKRRSGWHVRWRSDGNLRIISSTEVLTSKRNAERAIEAEAGVAEVHQDNDKLWAVLVDGSRREIRIVDERGLRD